MPTEIDVAIVGAGLTGLSAALALAKLGTRVAVFEAHDAGWGASSRNGGMVLTGLKLAPHELVARYGVDAARRLDAVSIAAIDFVEWVVRDEQIACDFARGGHVALASKPAHFEQFQRDAALINESFGRRVRLVPRAQIDAEVGSNVFFGGMIDDASAGVNPAQLVVGLAGAAHRAGATIYAHTRVTRIDARKPNGTSRFLLATERGEVCADQVVVATGAYTGQESPWLQQRIVPIGSYIIATEPLPEGLAREVSPRNRMMYDSKRFLHYFRLTPDRRVLFGGRASFVPESAHAIAQSAQILRRDMIALFPQLHDVAIEYAWGGSIDVTSDMLPHTGVHNGIHYAAGYAGHGVAMATYFGALLARKLAGVAAATSVDAATDAIMQRPFPAPPLALHRLIPGVVPAIGAWYGFLDRVS